MVGTHLCSAVTPFTVEAGSSQPAWTDFNLLAGHTYQVRVEGTFIYNSFLSDGTTFIADAEWAWDQGVKDGSWIERWPDPNGTGYFMDLLINGQGLDWRGTADLNPGPNSVFSAHTYSPSHVYETDMVGQGAPISFLVWDSDVWFDNAGSLSVSVIEVPEPTAGALAVLGLGALGFRRCRRS
jgi:MYXO-CTERM domain-containing protein